jgi:hypothetical protein
MEVEEDEDANVEPTDAVSAAGTELTKQTESTSVEGIVLAPASHETIPAIHSYQIKPVLADKYKFICFLC